MSTNLRSFAIPPQDDYSGAFTDEWQVFIRDHHEGFIDWETYKVIQERLRNNFVAHPHEVDGPVREGQAMLQGLATCGRCGRRLHVHYNGQKSSPGYHCPHTVLIDDKATNCLRVGGRQIDEAVVKVFLAEMNPAGIEAAITAETMLEEQRDVSTEQWHLEVERFQYEAEKAERRYRAVEPENRLVARGLESEWEKCLRKLSTAEAELVTREKIRPRELTTEQKDKLKELSLDIGKVWSASTTTDRDRKELLRTVIEEVNIKLEPELKADLTVRWRGGAISELNIELNRRHVPALRTDEDTIELVRRLAQHYPDQVIAGILSRQHRLTATGARFTKYSVNALRRYWKIAKFEPQAVTDKGELVPISKAAEILGIPTSTLHRYVTEGFVVGEQLTPGAPWQISITDELRSRFTDEEVEGFVSIKKAVSVLSVTRQTIMQKIKRGDLQAIYMRHGRQRELRIKIPSRADSDSGQLNLL